MYIYLYIYIYTHTHTHIYICIYIYIYIYYIGTPELNGRRGTLVRYNPGNGRWDVSLNGLDKVFALKPANLRLDSDE
jgi:hypothetical protein